MNAEPAETNPSSGWDDVELWRRAAAGSEACFTALYRHHQGPVYRFALRMSGSAALAEEVTQEVFLVLVRDPGRFDPRRGTLGAFLMGIARHVTLRQLARGARLAVLPEREPAAPAGLAADLERRDEIETVRRAVAALPVRYREVVVLCDLGGASYEDAAASLGRPPGTVRSRLNRARALLRGKLARRREKTGCLA